VADTPPTDAVPAPHPERKAADQAGVNPDLAAVTAKIPFQDSIGAREILSRVRVHLSPELATALPALLSEAPDPDSALISFERLLSEPSGEVQRLLNRHPFLAHYAIVVFGHSRFLGETLIQNPDLLQTFLRERNLDRSLSREEFHESLARFRSRSFENDVSLLLARFKRREYVRIMLRDVLRLASLAETTAEISALSDVLIEEALRDSENWLQRRYEAPHHLDAEGRLVDIPFTILSLGKLGGNELNYSSDVDLLYIFGDGEEPAGTKVSNREYFIRLAQQVTEVLARVTREGPVFRIDMRLRPQGGEGELAISLSHALKYYAHSAQDWERQALIKLRHSAGDEVLARKFIRSVQAYVYSGAAEEAGAAAALTGKRLNFAAIATSLASREKMHTRHRSRLQHSDQSLDVKLDRGGIRDIEFLVQCLQRVYGGAEPWLRSGGTLFSLQKLHDKRHLSGKEFHELTSAYEFLRRLEHRLQLRQGQQTHHLPAAPADLRILQRSLEGYASGEDRLGDVTVAVRRRMAKVAEIYHRIIHQQSRRRYELAEAEFELRSLAEPAGVEPSQQQMLERLAGDSPILFEITRRPDLGSQTRRNLLRFLCSAFTSSERYAALVRNPQAVERGLAILESSDYLTETLVRHPEEIAALAEIQLTDSVVGSDYLFKSMLSGPRIGSDPVFSYLASSSGSYSEKLSLLRQHYRHRIFAVGARDINELREVQESLTATTAVAEGAISAAFGIAEHPEGLSVLALGRLGTGEFDVLSDADLLFVLEEGKDRVALTKSAEQMMHALAAYTRDGSVFPVDTRLRPRGNEGDLLVTPAQLQIYFEQEAQPWEALTYTKLRFLTGSQEVGMKVKAATEVLFQRFASDPGFLPALQEMRQKLENAEPGEKSFKTSAGGMYDIDFLVGYLLVQHAVKDKGGSVRERLWRCVAAGALEKSDAAVLTHAAELFRTVDHVARLVVGRARKWLPATEHARQVTERLSWQILRRTFARGLEQELTETLCEVRNIYRRMLSRGRAS
jgi:[glutamine synthetase] adenylyltransferase / [glutamine synthetase]-adenylyl-L-tyrosine phosphorylase